MDGITMLPFVEIMCTAKQKRSQKTQNRTDEGLMKQI